MQTKEIPAAELEQEIIEFLQTMATKAGGKRTKPGCNLIHGKSCVLGTCVDNIPRVTPVDCYCDGTLTIWIASEPGSGKIANIRQNPQVAVTVFDTVDHSVEQKFIQVWGTAELINPENNAALFNEKMEAFGLNEALSGVVEEVAERGELPVEKVEETVHNLTGSMNIIKISPQKIRLLRMGPGAMPEIKFWENGRATTRVTGGF